MQHSLACPSKQNERKFFAPRDHNISKMFQYLRFLHTRDRIGDVIVWRYPERHIELSPVLVQVDFEVFGFLHAPSVNESLDIISGTHKWIIFCSNSVKAPSVNESLDIISGTHKWIIFCSNSVKGVNFLTHAKSLADRLGVRGWIRISRYGSAIGQIQGEKDRVDEMALWLRHTGSPGCRIEFVDYQNWHVLDGYDYKKFNARV